MDELERKLRSALTEMAEGVPPSHNAWTEQERRLALKSRRNRVRPALMAAVAAAVVALVAVPVVIFNVRNAPVDAGAVPLVTDTPDASPRSRPSSDQGKKVGYRSLGDEQLSTDPMVIGMLSPAKEPVAVYAYTVRTAKGLDQLCFAQNREGQEINGSEQAKYGQPQCSPLTRPKTGFSWGVRQAPGSGNAGATYLYVMSQPAATLMLRDANERLIVAQQKSTGAEFTVFVGYMDSKQPPKAWTVRDIDTRVLQNGP
ncbi:hypothetical protein JOF56_002290 [Kibdelosporangium banguiense]|uniref:Uncharacterized protein n=1 Tax=Kibdelosporangium banguiense TaxID=1365924 RepID=A0ABS4TCW8_9PSEU|nr:hypothetical protein [Kibdelosporangium banguiense]MBP2321905.1 hypothetical protein [Kibdelosporangium banguiense]